MVKVFISALITVISSKILNRFNLCANILIRLPYKVLTITFSEVVDFGLKDIYAEIEKRYNIMFLKNGTDQDHVCFLLQSIQIKSLS
jgi:hypothetical protein